MSTNPWNNTTCEESYHLPFWAPATQSINKKIRTRIKTKSWKIRNSNSSHSNRLLVYCTCVHIFIYMWVSKNWTHVSQQERVRIQMTAQRIVRNVLVIRPKRRHVFPPRWKNFNWMGNVTGCHPLKIRGRKREKEEVVFHPLSSKSIRTPSIPHGLIDGQYMYTTVSNRVIYSIGAEMSASENVHFTRVCVHVCVCVLGGLYLW